MQYRLRTLLIVVTIAGLCFGWIAHARRMAEYHLRLATTLSSRIAQDGRIEQKEAAQALRVLAERDADVRTIYDEKTQINFVSIWSSKDSVVLHLHQQVASDWETVGYHRKIALQYDRATFRPWVFLSENSIPQPSEASEEILTQPAQPATPIINGPASELLEEFLPLGDLRHQLPDPNAL